MARAMAGHGQGPADGEEDEGGREQQGMMWRWEATEELITMGLERRKAKVLEWRSRGLIDMD